MKTIIKSWFPIAVASSLVFVAMYIIAQQVIRESYNWPQIDAVNAASAQLADDDMSPAQIVDHYTNNVSIDQSGTLFMIIYDDHFNALVSNGTLDGATPKVPQSVLLTSDPAPTTHAVTWAPRADVRIAAVIEKVNTKDKTYYILAGRNLNQPELLNEYLLLLCAAGWLATVFVSLIAVALMQRGTRERLKRRAYRG